MILVAYFCHKCMTKQGEKPVPSEYVSVHVRSRIQGEDIRTYVEDLARIVGIHHSFRGCSEQKADLMIPAMNQKGIGY